MKFAILVIVLTSTAIGLVMFLFFLFLRENLAYVFTESSYVAKAVAHLSPLLAFSLLLNSIQPVLSGELPINSRNINHLKLLNQNKTLLVLLQVSLMGLEGKAQLLLLTSVPIT